MQLHISIMITTLNAWLISSSWPTLIQFEYRFCLDLKKQQPIASLCPEKSVREDFCLIMIDYPKQIKQGVKTI